MVDGINELSGFPLPAIDGRHGRGSRYGRAEEDSRECPGPSSEATLHRPSPRRVLTAGVIALAAVAPAIDPIESTADSARALPPLTPVRVESATLDSDATFLARTGPLRASRSAVRRSVSARPAAAGALRRPAILAALSSTNAAVIGLTREIGLVAGSGRQTTLARRAVRAARPVVQQRRTYRTVVTKHAAVSQSARRIAVGGGMSAVIAYARSQIGRSYVTGGDGGSGFDCSGLTMRAYARAGISLPHSSWGQAARAHAVSRGAARPGDLVVGPGHVGIYVGRGMMIDAGNHRTGVVYRPLYSGLSLERF